MKSKAYVYPHLGGVDFFWVRLFGPGLGNLLFSWARALVFSRNTQALMVWPTWPQLKSGPLIRRERDTRCYVGLFSPTKHYVTGLKRFVLLLLRPQRLTIIKGHEDLFGSIKRDYEFVWRELIAITHPRHQLGLQYDYKDTISVHVRLGDFAVPADVTLVARGGNNYRIPLAWYVASIQKIREAAGKPLRVLLFSDGKDEELRQITELANVERISFGSSIADLLALSQSKLLIASGSTYSMWASYFGRMPVIWHTGQRKQQLYTEQPEAEIECGLDEQLPLSFANIINLIFGRSC